MNFAKQLGAQYEYSLLSGAPIVLRKPCILKGIMVTLGTPTASSSANYIVIRKNLTAFWTVSLPASATNISYPFPASIIYVGGDIFSLDYTPPASPPTNVKISLLWYD